MARKKQLNDAVQIPLKLERADKEAIKALSEKLSNELGFQIYENDLYRFSISFLLKNMRDKDSFADMIKEFKGL